ncbi:hypothetical protein QMT40_001774 [Parvibaculaceae bacterium PLY_AMNH_Bact1]|nr:hypothetical protein QMT40_001774 [Parvibaculaceae bacterium PLY_AMNH_Bact1]
MKIVLCIIAVLTFSSPAFANIGQFCAGFESGYAAGYMRGANTSIPPITPICPIQPIKSFSDPQSDYEHGYVVGYEKGQSEGRSQSTYR